MENLCGFFNELRKGQMLSYCCRCRMVLFSVVTLVTLLAAATSGVDDVLELPAESQDVLDFVNSARTTWKVIRSFFKKITRLLSISFARLHRLKTCAKSE